MDETNQPEDEDKDEEKYRIDNLHKVLAEINLPVTATLFKAPGLAFSYRSLLLSEWNTLIGRDLS